MKHTLAYLGNEHDAAGWRLAGALAIAPEAGDEAAAFERALRAASLLLLSSEVAAALPPALLEPALAALQPLVLVLPEAGRGPLVLDPAERVRRQLGLEPERDDAAETR